MKVMINGTQTELYGATTITDMLQELEYGETGFAIAIDGVFVPRTLYADTTLSENMDIELVAPMQGG